MSIKFLQSKKTTLSYAISDSATTIQLDELLKLDGTSVAASDIGDALQGTFAPGTAREEIFEIDGANVTVNSDGTVTITSVLRGRKEVEPYGAGGFATDHGPGEVVVFGNNPQLYNRMAILANDNAFTGDNTFVNNPQKTTSNLAANNNDFITKNDLLNAVLGSVTTDQVIISGTAGENLTAGNIAYFKEADQKWWKADADLVGTFDQVVVAVVQNTAVTDASVNILLQGVDKTQTGLTLGAKYYLSNTAGAMSTTPGTTEVFLGWAQTATRFIFDPLGLYQPTSGEKAAMGGTSGIPSSTNEYVTQNDTTNGASIVGTTIAFVNSNPDTITDSGNGFVTAGFQAGQSITVTGSASNNNTFTIASVAAGVITLVTGDSLVAESAGANVTIVAVKVGKVIRFDDNGAYPEADGSNLTNINSPSLIATYGEDISAGKPVFFGDGTTIKRVVAGNATYSIQTDTFPTTATNRIGQTFIAGMPRMTGFGLTINNNTGGNAGVTLTYDIYATSAGLPTGASLKSGTIVYNSISSGAEAWAEATFGSALTLTTGNTYAICIYAGTNNFRFRRFDTDGNQYVDGSYITESTSVWSAGTGDMAFMVFNSTATTQGYAYISSSYEAPYQVADIQLQASNAYSGNSSKNFSYLTSSTRVDGITKDTATSGNTGTVITGEGLATITPPTLQTTISSTIDQQNTASTTPYSLDSSGKYAWFTFTTGDIDVLEKIELYLAKTGTPGTNLTVSVMNLDQNGVPPLYYDGGSGIYRPNTGAVLGSVTYTNADISGAAFYSKTFSTPISVKPRTRYAVFIQYDTYVATNYFSVYYSSNHSDYRYGVFGLNATTLNITGTFAFKLYTTSTRYGYIGDNLYIGKTAGTYSFFPTYDGRYVKVGKLSTATTLKVNQGQTGNMVSYFKASGAFSTNALTVPTSTNTKRADVIFDSGGTPEISISFDLETGIVIGNNVQSSSTGNGLKFYRVIMPTGKSFAQHLYIIFDSDFSVASGGSITVIQYE